MSEKPYTGRNDPDLHPEPAPARQSHNGSGAEGLSGTDEPKDYQFRSTTVPAQLHYDAISEVEQPKKKWWSSLLVAGSAPQIVLAALVAIAIGLGVSSAVERVPQSALDLVNIPGRLWLRALTAVVLPLIITAMILAIQRLKEMSRGGSALVKWTLTYYFSTTVIAISHSLLMTALVWRPLFTEVDAASLQVVAGSAAATADRDKLAIHQVVVTLFDSFIPNNVVNALSSNSLLAVLTCAIVVGCLIQGPESKSSLLRATKEVDRIITIIITFLIKLAPVGVFFLVLSNIMRLDVAQVGRNLGILIAATISSMAIHLLFVFFTIFYVIVRQNPAKFWVACAPAWITAWGTASSAATLPVTMRQVIARKIPVTIAKFTVPLGCLVNMDGTAIYFPICVTFLAATQGITLNAAEYIIVLLLSTVASIGATPIPSSSLVLTVMIANSVNVPITGMYAVVVAIDWFLDRFRTALNVSSDLFAAKIVYVLTKIEDDPENGSIREEDVVQDAVNDYNREVRRE